MQELSGFPWLVGGDLNEIFYDGEKSEGNARPYQQTQILGTLLRLSHFRILIGVGSSLPGLIAVSFKISYFVVT